MRVLDAEPRGQHAPVAAAKAHHRQVRVVGLLLELPDERRKVGHGLVGVVVGGVGGGKSGGQGWGSGRAGMDGVGEGKGEEEEEDV